MPRYMALIDGKTGEYGVVFPDLPGCTAMGKTVEQAIANAAEALSDWIQIGKAYGDRVPEPRSFPKLLDDPDVIQAIDDGAMVAAIG